MSDAQYTDWSSWAMKMLALVIAALLGYSTVNAERLQSKLVDLQSHHAVEEERWKSVEKRLEKIEGRLDELVQLKPPPTQRRAIIVSGGK